VAFALLGGSGCGGKTNNTYPVSGKVTMNGQPLELGTVLFKSVVEGEARSTTARASIDKNGFYELSTFGESDGALAGRHKVIVIAKPYDSEEFTGRKPKSIIPLHYASSETSGLEYEVSKGVNEINIELTEMR